MTAPSKFEKWNNLPEEMKLECIKLLDFKTRFQLRDTCHTERRLVNSQKFKVRKMFIRCRDKFEVSIQVGEHEKKWSHQPELEKDDREDSDGDDEIIENIQFYFDDDKILSKAIPFISLILQNGKVGELSIVASKYDKLDILSHLNGTSPFHIRRYFGELTNELSCIFQKCARNSFEKILFACLPQEQNFPIDEFLGSQSLNSTKYWNILLSYSSDIGQKVAQKWMEIDVDVGSTLKLRYTGNDTIDDFAAVFADFKVIDKSDALIRIETKNPGKHMILKFIEEVELYRGRDCECVLKVVPFNIKDSEIEKIEFYD